MVKSKPNALRHCKVDPVLKIDETVHKQAESMCTESLTLKLCDTNISMI